MNPITIDDFKALEDRFLFQLPGYYKEFLLHYPKELYSLGMPYNSASDLYLVASAKAIADLNELFYNVTDKISIGQDGCGNYYFISRDSSDRTIYFLDHEDIVIDEATGKMDWSRSLKPDFKNIDAYIKFLKQLLKDG